MESSEWVYDSVIEGENLKSNQTWILWSRTKNGETRYTVTKQPDKGVPKPPKNVIGTYGSEKCARIACGDRALEGEIYHWGGGLAKLKNPFVDSPGYKKK